MGDVVELLPPGSRLGPYRIDRRAGAGGMGVVYLAHDVDLDRPVALKVLRPTTGLAVGAERLVREARSAARVHHPNVAAVHHVGRDGDVAYLALEWVDGVTLAEHLRQQVILDWPEATAAVRDAAHGLAAAHAAGVVHRDVKPANLIRSAADGRVKVVDFGLARVHDVPTDLSGTGVILGTPAYLSPEQCRGERGTAASDVYALGCTYYHLLTSRPPFAADRGSPAESDGSVAGLLYRRLAEPFPDARRYADDVPAPVLAVLARSTAADPVDRYPTMAAMAVDLDAVLAGSSEAVAVAPAEPEPVAATPNNLPRPATSFVGRAHEVATVKAMLRDHRLTTLLGPGGAGKTRLSVRVGTDLLSRFPDGVWFVDLSPVTTADAVGSAVAAAVAAPLAGRSLPTVAAVDHLRAARALVVLDNCEHVIEAAADVAAALLAGCPSVHLLATSRSALGCSGEAEFRLPPLSTPPADPGLSAAELRQHETVRLLVDRAALVRPSFALTDDNAFDVASVCRKLDGLPLAIELAAARLRSLSPRQVADRLGDALGLLTTGPRTAQPRQRTLRSVLDWSHDLLTVAERVALARLSVFAGSASLEAIEAVLPDPTTDGPIAPADVIDLVGTLIDKSLLVVEERAGVNRYRQLETVRQYAAGRLATSADGPAVRDRHLAYFARLIESTFGPCSGPDGSAVLASLDLDHDNVRAALDHGGGNEQAQRLLGSISQYWLRRGNLVEGLARSNAVLAAAVAARQITRHTADAYNTAGILAYNVGQLAEAKGHYVLGLAAARQFGDTAGEATALTTLSSVLKDLGDLASARAHAEAALDLRRQHGTPSGVAGGMNNLANLLTRLPDEQAAARAMYRQSQAMYRQQGNGTWVAYIDLNLGLLELKAGDTATARRRYSAALTDLNALGDFWGAASALQGLAECDLGDGDRAEAARRVAEAIAVARDVGDRSLEAESLITLTKTATASGDPVAATAHAGDALRLFRQLDDPTGIADALKATADAVRSIDPTTAAVCLGAAVATRAARSIPLFGIPLADHDALHEALINTLGRPAFDAAFAAGQAAPGSAGPPA